VRLFVILMSLFGMLSAFSANACSSVSATHQNRIQPVDSSLRSELVRLGREDQASRDKFGAAAARNDTAYGRQLMAADSARTKRLRAIVRAYGWPGRSLVGKDGAAAAWLILQHSPSTEFQKALLPTLWAAAERGEMEKADVAMLTDRVLVHTGHPQRYGSQFSVQNGRLLPDSIEDLPGLEARRTAVGLPGMAEYVRMLGQMYGLPVTWPPAP
jgi:hypothetical protein